MSIIEELYDNDMLHYYDSDSSEYKTALDKVRRIESELMSRFPECRELFEEYQSAETELTGIDVRQEFVRGFKLGGQVIIEILLSTDDD